MFVPPAVRDELWPQLPGLSIEEAWPLIVERVEAYNEANPKPKRIRFDDLFERGSADAARQWVRAAEIDETARAVFLDFIDRFPTLRFSRFTDAALAEVEKPDELGMPAWLPPLLRALKGSGGSLVFRGTKPETDAASFQITPDSRKRSELKTFGIYRILSTIEHYDLYVNAWDPSDRSVRWMHWSDVADIDGWENIVTLFDDYLDMYRECCAVGRWEDGELKLTHETRRAQA